MTPVDFSPSPETAREFRRALGRFSTGITVVTCLSEVGPLGITANSFASVSLDPPLVLWSPAKTSRRFDAFTAAETFAIHVLAEDQLDICRRFSGDGLVFEGLDWNRGINGVPVIEDVLARFECTRRDVHDGGDHAIVVGLVDRVTFREGDPLVFSSGTYGGFRKF